jgi:dihydroneopterin aldolase
MGVIHVTGIRLYAYHGCLPEEAKIGAEYIVDVKITTDYTSAAINDTLAETIDYCTVYAVVKAEMAIRSRLIEHVCQRILSHLKSKFPKARFEVKLTKLRPPMNGDVESVSVILEN